MNTQQPSPLFLDPTGLLELHSIFPTIQGEGIFAGEPALFVRLAGCNLKCPFCDTDYTENTLKVKPDYILDRVEELHTPNKLVVITGGEPFRQNLETLCSHLIYRGYRVQIETNGTLPPSVSRDILLNRNFHIVCSPKVGRIDEALQPHIDAYKYVLQADNVSLEDGLPTRVLGLKCKGVARPHNVERSKVFVQPMDSKSDAENFRNLDVTIKSAMKHGYTLCLQIHKIINVE